jgi:hypothetical protein
MKKFVFLLACFVGSCPLFAQSEGSIVVVISPELPGVEVLINEMHEDSRIVFFNAAENPLTVITKAIRENAPVKSLHILSESRPGRLMFRGEAWPIDSLDSNEMLLGSWSQYFVEHGDLLLYGCELAKGEQGLAFVQQLAILTGLDVAASKDMTGSALLNGDWNLEVRSGNIESKLVVSRNVASTYTTVLRSDTYATGKRKKRASHQRSAVASLTR